MSSHAFFLFFFFNDTATTEIYTLSLHDALPIYADLMPALSIVRFPNDHTTGMKNGFPTPQFMVADNDYAVGRLVAAVSSSAYWKDTAIFIVEDDAQAGPDHVNSHRSVGLPISAYNRPAPRITQFHTTVS